MQKHVHQFRQRLANPDSLLQLSALGVVSGVSCALVMLLFRLVTDVPVALWLPGNNPDNFEALPTWLHFGLPVAGALLLGLALKSMNPADTRTGVAHVIARLHAHNGHLPLKNALVQFFGGAIAIATGQSGGREGPAIHLGAAANSLLGQKLLLPNNSIRTLVACGTAAAIAASFNTPIAGVIFAMEVVMMEYTVTGFIPVMLAAITGTAITRGVYGSEMLFNIPAVQMASLWELPFIALLGLVCGGCAALFMGILKVSLRYADRPVVKRLAMAGAITGCCALLVPEVMGIGYDSLNAALAGELPLILLMALIAAKIIATAASSGLGLPIGLIGPNLLIGACIGSAMGLLASYFFPDITPQRSFYVLLGMGAMMAAILNAPLAALMALLEFSGSTEVIFPAMLAITVATLTNSEVFKQRSAHQTVLLHLKQLLHTDPVSLALQRTSVATIMQRNLVTTEPRVSAGRARQLLADQKSWYVIGSDSSEQLSLIRSQDLNHQLEAALDDAGNNPIDLLAIATQQQPVAELHIQATLREALTVMDHKKVDALYVSGYISGPYPDNGIVLRRDVESYYLKPQHSNPT